MYNKNATLYIVHNKELAKVDDNIVVNSVIVKKKLRNNTYLVVTNPIFFLINTQIPQILPIHHSTLACL